MPVDRANDTLPPEPPSEPLFSDAETLADHRNLNPIPKAALKIYNNGEGRMTKSASRFEARQFFSPTHKNLNSRLRPAILDEQHRQSPDAVRRLRLRLNFYDRSIADQDAVLRSIKQTSPLTDPGPWIRAPKNPGFLDKVAAALEAFERCRRFLQGSTPEGGIPPTPSGINLGWDMLLGKLPLDHDHLAYSAAAEMGNLAHFLSPAHGDPVLVEFRGTKRGPEFFMKLGAETLISHAEANNRPLKEYEFKKVQSLIKHLLWYEPTLQSTNIAGVIYSRAELQEITEGKQSSIKLDDDIDLDKISGNLEKTTLRQGHETQSVHNNAVLEAARLTTQLMKQKAGQPLPGTFDETTEAITALIESKPESELSEERKGSAKTGIGIIFQNVQSNWDDGSADTQRMRRENQENLHLVWNYIDKVTDTELQSKLIDSLIERLIEIDQERPCHVGVNQRLLDVPSGIDPDMNLFAMQKQLEDETMTVSARVNELFQEQIVGMSEKCTQGKCGEEVDDDVLREIGMDMAGTRIRNQFGTLRAFSKANYEPSLKKAVEGMKYVV